MLNVDQNSRSRLIIIINIPRLTKKSTVANMSPKLDPESSTGIPLGSKLPLMRQSHPCMSMNRSGNWFNRHYFWNWCIGVPSKSTNDFCDLLRTPDAPVSKIASVKDRTFGILASYNGIVCEGWRKTSRASMAVNATMSSISDAHTMPAFIARISNGLSFSLNCFCTTFGSLQLPFGYREEIGSVFLCSALTFVQKSILYFWIGPTS